MDHRRQPHRLGINLSRCVIKSLSATLGEAAVVLEAHPAAMQLRVLSTMAEVSAERNSTLIFPLPIDLLRLVDTMRASGAVREPEPSGR